MTASAVVALLGQVIANLPAAITTGQQVVRLVNDVYTELATAVGDRDPTADEIDLLVSKIVTNNAAIQAIE